MRTDYIRHGEDGDGLLVLAGDAEGVLLALKRNAFAEIEDALDASLVCIVNALQIVGPGLVLSLRAWPP